ncbi:hypothetical protein BDV98DRAFT_601663 [Pterulicium gracile]|uniref:Nnf1-domain-containing protein n=1 Tax=Pterulicium gracile TaxID=1884261 RepID=A0A5C3QV65_9AGAR|nr:hypothetical protein BDV98DRAFT_601663 [Pterula gracilis]
MSSTTVQQDTKRYKHFSSAIQLAIRRAAHKWTFENFCECFPLWTEESQHAAASLFNSISTFHENDLTKKIEDVFERYHARESLNLLEELIQEAVESKERGEPPQGTFREHVDPSDTLAAHTLPVVEEANKKLAAKLAELEAENDQLLRELEAEEAQVQQLEALHKARLDRLAKALDAWQERPMNELEHLNLDLMEMHESNNRM